MLKAIVPRAQKLLLTPKAGWAEIDGESVSVPELYKGYVAPLAAIPVLAKFVGVSLLGLGLFHIPLIAGVGQMVVGYVLSLASIYVFALIIDYLAPTFGGQKNFGQAFKVAAYTPTAVWVAGIFNIIPALGIISLLGGLYSLYLLFVGLPALMKPPEDKAMIYTLASIGCAIVVEVIIALIVSRLFVPTVVMANA
jgi:hypothetical protein